MIPNLQAVFEQHYLNTTVACVAAMYHGIDNGLSDGLWRQFGCNIHRDGCLYFIKV